MKTCSKCKTEKDLSEFGLDKSHTDGFNHRCKACSCLHQKELRIGNPVRYKAKYKKYYLKHSDGAKARAKKWREANLERAKATNRAGHQRRKLAYPGLSHETRLRYQYNMTPKQYDQMLINQLGCCAICKTAGIEEVLKGRKLSVDHCHATNKIRGLLCKKCNSGLGMFQDNKNMLSTAIEYLVKSEVST